MKSRYVVSTAVAALLAGTLLAAAQGQRQPQGGGAERGEQSQEQRGQEQRGQEQRGQEQRGQEKSRTQGQRDQDQGKGQRSQGRDQDRNQGQSERQQGQREEGKSQPDQKQAPGKRQQGQSQQRDGGGGSATLTTEQRTKIRQTVLEGNKAPRVSNVTFNVQVGTAVPRKGVRVVTVPRDLIEIYPSWRGFLYFVYEDEIVIVNPRTYRIVAVIPA